jgi:hypothetical protein
MADGALVPNLVTGTTIVFETAEGTTRSTSSTSTSSAARCSTSRVRLRAVVGAQIGQSILATRTSKSIAPHRAQALMATIRNSPKAGCVLRLPADRRRGCLIAVMIVSA